jgi:hypothetical protein
LRAFDGVLEAAKELLEVFVALDEVDGGGVDDEKVGGGVAEEEVFVGVGDFFDVFGRDLGFVAGGFLAMRARRTSGLAWRYTTRSGAGIAAVRES